MDKNNSISVRKQQRNKYHEENPKATLAQHDSGYKYLAYLTSNAELTKG
jgi:hypothetical protein